MRCQVFLKLAVFRYVDDFFGLDRFVSCILFSAVRMFFC